MRYTERGPERGRAAAREAKLARSSAAALVLAGLTACTSAATKRCHEDMIGAQALVTKVDSKDVSSVESSLMGVQDALASCQAAGRSGEVEELTKARNQLQGHLDYMKKRAAQTPAKKRSAEEMAEIVKHGDPECPKGQAYRDTQLAKEIRCTGPQPADMSRARADEYYRSRGYKITTTDAPPTLRAEYGAELLVYTYGGKDDPAPRCLSFYPPPGMSWQEAASRVTGVTPQKLEKATSVRTDRGSLPIAVENTDAKVLVRIGECG